MLNWVGSGVGGSLPTQQEVVSRADDAMLSISLSPYNCVLFFESGMEEVHGEKFPAISMLIGDGNVWGTTRKTWRANYVIVTGT